MKFWIVLVVLMLAFDATTNSASAMRPASSVDLSKVNGMWAQTCKDNGVCTTTSPSATVWPWYGRYVYEGFGAPNLMGTVNMSDIDGSGIGTNYTSGQSCNLMLAGTVQDKWYCNGDEVIEYPVDKCSDPSTDGCYTGFLGSTTGSGVDTPPGDCDAADASQVRFGVTHTCTDLYGTYGSASTLGTRNLDSGHTDHGN